MTARRQKAPQKTAEERYRNFMYGPLGPKVVREDACRFYEDWERRRLAFNKKKHSSSRGKPDGNNGKGRGKGTKKGRDKSSSSHGSHKGKGKGRGKGRKPSRFDADSHQSDPRSSKASNKRHSTRPDSRFSDTEHDPDRRAPDIEGIPTLPPAAPTVVLTPAPQPALTVILGNREKTSVCPPQATGRAYNLAYNTGRAYNLAAGYPG